MSPTERFAYRLAARLVAWADLRAMRRAYVAQMSADLDGWREYLDRSEARLREAQAVVRALEDRVRSVERSPVRGEKCWE